MGIFTGLILETGILRRLERRSDGACVTIDAHIILDGTRVGDSIAINGVDLTVTEMNSTSFSADASPETLNRSTIGTLAPGTRVNLERALALGERFGGHMVQGHVDGIAELISISPEGNAKRMRFQLPIELSRYVAMKGSVAVDGIGLSVAGVGNNWFEVVIIPHTWRETTLGDLHEGSKVNIEVDILAKYVERLLQNNSADKPKQSRITLDYLKEKGF